MDGHRSVTCRLLQYLPEVQHMAKDDWYNPKLFRRGNTMPPHHAVRRESVRSSVWGILFFWILLGALLFGGFKFYQHYQSQKLDAQVNAIAAKYWKEQAEKAMQQNAKKPKVDFFK